MPLHACRGPGAPAVAETGKDTEPMTLDGYGTGIGLFVGWGVVAVLAGIE